MINFKPEKEPKMKLFDFETFQKIMQMLSHDKIIFHVLFGAIHDTPVYRKIGIFYKKWPENDALFLSGPGSLVNSRYS